MDTSHGKRSCHLDLRSAEDAARLAQLVKRADVFSQGYRGGAMARLGFDAETLHALRPGLIYTSINCYGHEGPWQDRAGWEQLAQTTSGMAAAHGGEAPALVPAAATDYATGYLAALGTLAALVRRAEEGGSYHVRVSLTQTAMLYLRQPRVSEPAVDLTGDERRSLCTKSATAGGELVHLGPVVEMSDTQPHWTSGPVETGTHPAAWW